MSSINATNPNVVSPSATPAAATPGAAPAAGAANTNVGPVMNSGGQVNGSASGTNNLVTPPASPLPPHAVVQPTAAELQKAEAALQAYSAGRGRTSSAGTRAANGSWTRGLLAFEVKPLPNNGGAELYVYSGHATHNDTLTMNIQVKALIERNGQMVEQLINLQPTQRISPNPGSFVGVQRYIIDFNQLNAYFAQHAPQAPGLRLKNGADIVVSAVWQNGHQWGGVGRDGTVKLELGNAQGVSGPAQAATGGTVERDLAVPIDQATRTAHPVLAAAGAYKSHIESETKARVPFSKLKSVYDKLMLLARPSATDQAAQQKLMQEIFGAEASEWKVTPVEKYWLKDNAGQFKSDANGFFETNAFTDLYFDNQARDLAAREMALRARTVSGERLQYENWNLKPGPGERDAKSNVSNRIEVELPFNLGTQYNAAPVLDFFADDSQVLNAWKLIKTEDPTIKLADKDVPGSAVTNPSVHIVGRRYKFEFEHKSGVAFEVSVDSTMGLALNEKGLPLKVDANGKPDANGGFYAVATFGQMEMELNHLNFNAAGSAGAQAGGQPAVANHLNNYGNAPGVFGPPQEQWLKTVAAGSAITGAVRVHTREDLKDPTITEEASYKHFVKVVPALQEALLGGKVGKEDGAMPGKQKAAMAVQLAGALALSPEERKLFTEELAATAAFRQAFVGPAVDQVIKQCEAQLTAVETQLTQFKTQIAAQRDQNINSYKTNMSTWEMQLAAVEKELVRYAPLGAQSPKYRTLLQQKRSHEQNISSYKQQIGQFETQYEDQLAQRTTQLMGNAQQQVQQLLRNLMLQQNPMSFVNTGAKSGGA